MVDDNSTTGRKYHDKARIVGFVAGSRAVAPAGGCVVLVICIAVIAIAVDRDTASHATESKRS